MRVLRLVVALGAVPMILAHVGVAWADEPAEAGPAHADAPRVASPSQMLASGKVVIGLERVVSLFTYESVSITPSGSTTSTTISGTSLALFASDPGGVNNAFYVVPRLAVDVIAAAHLTLGGAAWIYTQPSLSQSSSSSASIERPKATYGGIAPRIGYILPIADAVAFWPRAGIEYHSLSNSTVTQSVSGTSITSGGTSLSQLAADVEANLVITPWNHVGFDLEAYGAIPISGSVSLPASAASSSASFSELVAGVTAGLLVYM